MWTKDVIKALEQIYEIYGSMCCIERIHDNLIVMSNFDKYTIDSNGNITLVKEMW